MLPAGGIKSFLAFGAEVRGAGVDDGAGDGGVAGGAGEVLAAVDLEGGLELALFLGGGAVVGDGGAFFIDGVEEDFGDEDAEFFEFEFADF